MPAAKLSEEEVESRTQNHLQNTIIVDALHGHLVDPEPHPRNGKSYFERLVESGMNVVSMTLAARPLEEDFDTIIRNMYHYFNLMSFKRDETLHIETVDDIYRAHKEKKIGIMFGTQTGSVVGRDMTRWTILHKLGLRLAQITYNERNWLGDGCLEPENRGLTTLGRQAVQEMQRLGITADGSHVGERTTLDAMEMSLRPFVFSHANPKALCPSRRCITDEQIKACAATGGVIGISPHSNMTYREDGVQATFEQYLDNYDYVRDLVGIDHVAIGTDMYESYTKLSWESSTKRLTRTKFIYETMYCHGFSKVDEFPDTIRGLIRRGYSDEDLTKLLGGNWIRVFGETWGPGEGT